MIKTNFWIGGKKILIKYLMTTDQRRLPIDNSEGPPISRTEVEKALRKMKNGTAAGGDEITAEMLKALGDFGIEKLTVLFNNIYNTGFLPEEMLSSIYITLPKKPKAPDCGHLT